MTGAEGIPQPKCASHDEPSCGCREKAIEKCEEIVRGLQDEIRSMQQSRQPGLFRDLIESNLQDIGFFLNLRRSLLHGSE